MKPTGNYHINLYKYVRIEEELKRNLAQQRAENTKLSQQISSIKTDKTSLQKNLLALQKRIQELELQIGGEDQPK